MPAPLRLVQWELWSHFISRPPTIVLAPEPRRFYKEKFNVLLSGDKHKDLSNFAKHLETFTGLGEIAKGKGLGENPEVTIARVQKAGSGVETFSLRTQEAWKYEFEEKKRVFNRLNERFGSNRTGDIIFSTRSFRTLHTKMNIS